MFEVRPIYVQDSTFKMSSVSPESLKTRQQNGPKLEIFLTAINTCLIINVLSLWLI